MQANQRRTPFSLEGDYTPIRRTTQELPATIEIPKIKSLLRRYNEWLRAGSDFVEVIDTLVGALHFWYDEVQSYLGEHNLEHLRPHIDMFFLRSEFSGLLSFATSLIGIDCGWYIRLVSRGDFRRPTRHPWFLDV